MEIDLGAERLISAEKDHIKILIEVKSFLNRSLTYDFHAAYGQYRIYQRGVKQNDPQYSLYLAMPEDVYEELFQKQFYRELIKEEDIKLIIFSPLSNRIISWID